MSNVSGSTGGGEHGSEDLPGGGEGTQSQRQRAGPDALPGGSTALPVHIYKSLYRSHFVRIVFNFSSTVPHMEILIHT